MLSTKKIYCLIYYAYLHFKSILQSQWSSEYTAASTSSLCITLINVYQFLHFVFNEIPCNIVFIQFAVLRSFMVFIFEQIYRVPTKNDSVKILEHHLTCNFCSIQIQMTVFSDRAEVYVSSFVNLYLGVLRLHISPTKNNLIRWFATSFTN